MVCQECELIADYADGSLDWYPAFQAFATISLIALLLSMTATVAFDNLEERKVLKIANVALHASTGKPIHA